jgi:Tfp pilus assembly PilM family ATPase
MNQKFLKKILRRKRYLVLNISTTVLTLAHIQSAEEEIKVLHYDAKYIDDLESFDDKQLMLFITNFLDNNYIVDRDIILSLDGLEGVIIKEFSMTEISEDEQSSAILWQLISEKTLPSEDYFLSWQFLSDTSTKNKKEKRKTLVAAFKESEATRYLTILEKCSLIPISLTHPLFHRHYLLKNTCKAQELTAVLDLQFTNTHLAFYKGTQLIFLRPLPLTVEKLLKSIGSDRRSYLSDEGHFYTSIDESEENFMLMRSFLDMLIREIQLSKEYCKLSLNAPKINHFFMSGESSSIKNLDQYLTKALDINVQTMAIPKNTCQINLSEKNSFLEDRMADCFAISLEGPKKANALPLEFRTKKSERMQKVILWSISLSLATVFLLLILGIQLYIDGSRKQVINTNYNLNLLKEIIPLREHLNSWIVLHNQLIKKDILTEGILKFISLNIPPEIYLEDLFIDAQPGEIILTGYIEPVEINQKQILSKFINHLKESDLIGYASILYTQKDEKGMAFRIKGEILDK